MAWLDGLVFIGFFALICAIGYYDDIWHDR